MLTLGLKTWPVFASFTNQVSAEDLLALQEQTVTYTTNSRGESVVRYQGSTSAAAPSAPASSFPSNELEGLLAFLEQARAHNAELQVFETA